MKKKRLILVTGIPRSGTTWMGKMIGISPQAGYLWEPLGMGHRPGVCALDPVWFPYITKTNHAQYFNAITDTANYNYNFKAEFNSIWAELKKARSINIIRTLKGRIRVMIVENIRFHKYKKEKRVPLFKDPLSLFLSEWYYKHFDAKIIIMIRHPAAVIASHKRLQWRLNSQLLLKQPALIQDHLNDYRSELLSVKNKTYDLIEDGIIMWNIIYSTVQKYRRKYKDWLFLKHEEVASDPLKHYPKIFNFIGIDYTLKIEESIKKYCLEPNMKSYNIEKRAHNIKLYSPGTAHSWKNEMSSEEVRKIRTCVEKVSSSFYSNYDWQI